MILDGVFNHCGSFNKWLNREKIYRPDKGYAPGAYEAADSPYHDYFHFYDENQWPDNGTYEGWWGHDTLPKLNYEGSDRYCTAISWRSGKNGFLRLTMQMAGDLMLQQIWGTAQNSTIGSGVISVKQSRVQTRMPSFWQSIMGMRLPGYRAMPGIRS